MNNALDFTPDTALFKKDWLPLEQAIQKVARFEHEFGEAHLALACHAALASILTPELVNLIRINFLETSVEWIAECDLLLSSLCQPINQGVYEIEPQIRQVLLVALQTHSKYGAGRLEEIAHFLYRYSETDFVNALPLHIKRTYQWISGAYIDPDATIQDMFNLLKNVRAEDFMARMPDYLHIGKTLAMIANPLEMSGLQVELEDLVSTAQLSTLYWTGDKENLLSLLPENTSELDEITNALTKPVVDWLATSDFVTSDERALALLSISESMPVTKDTVRTERKPVTIFCSYAYRDEELQRELAEYLAPLQARGLITYWHNPLASLDDIEDHKKVVDEYLNTAQIILLLISPDFMVSEYHYEFEMQRAMERHEQGDARVIPIILRLIAGWQDEPIGSLQALPINAIPVTTWEDRSLAFAEVVSGIERVVEELQTPEGDLHEIARQKEISMGTEPLEVFLVYAHEDISFLIELEKHLSPLREQGLITTWSDRQITPGADRRQVIDMQLDRASLILFLVSPRFFMSEECSYQMQKALQHYQMDEALVIPIIVRPCIWKDAPFAVLQPLPRNDEPITIWKDRRAAFADVVDGIENVAKELQERQRSPKKSRSREHRIALPAIEIFFVYAYDDKHFSDEIYDHLYPLYQKGLIIMRYGHQLSPGSDINEYLERASLFLLLVSPHFLNSDKCNHETQKALQRHQANGARIIPIIVRPCNWENEVFAHLQALPTYSKPITRWSHQDAAIVDVANGIQRVIEDIKEPQTLPEIGNQMEAITLPIEVFLAYAHEDEAFLIELEKHLSPLRRQGLIKLWSDRQILPGSEWKQVIDMRLNRANIILLLVSPYFLNSNYSGLEMQRALQRHQENEARVIPIIVQPCEWISTPFAHLPVWPVDGNPITNWDDPSEAFADVANGVRRVVSEFTAVPELQQVKQLEQQPKNLLPSINNTEHPATVFVSYALSDLEEVRDLQIRLNVRGVRCWHDVDDLHLYENKIENEIVKAIEHDVDAIVLFLTPESLQSEFIWRVEVFTALRRYERDSQFHIVPILLGVTFAEVRQFCHNRNITDITNFNWLSLNANGAARVEQRNEAARRILRSAFAERLRRINANHNYEPSLLLRTFVFALPTASLDLSLDWLELIQEKEHISTQQNWEEILWPALIDVKQTISGKIASRRIHLFVKSLLPVAIALGFAFRESTWITLLLEGQKEIWSTETHPSEKEPLRIEHLFNEEEDSNATVEVEEGGASEEILLVEKLAVVEVAVSRSIKQAVAETLSAMNILPTYQIRLEAPEFSRESVRDAAQARAIAQQVGRVCQELCDEQGVRHLHLFVAIPVELAVLIGHQLNALCPITLYEFKNEKGIYEPFCTLLQ